VTASFIAEIKDSAQCALRSDAHPYHARRVIELCEEIERQQREYQIVFASLRSADEEINSLRRELAEIKAAISDPAAVWANMLRGTIARPAALDHYEECKSEVERLQRELAELRTTVSRAAN
jgi:predicted RNase H-like nuclease (RuvC/YqgF family)